MANIRIKDLANTASSTASDDFIGVDGTTNGTRKLNAYSPTFGGNATVGGALNVTGGSMSLTGTGRVLNIPSAGINWGNDDTPALDVNLYRLSANNLKTDDNLTVGGTLTVNGAATFNATATISSAGIADAYLKINNTFGKEVRLYSGIIGTNNNGFSVRNETDTTDWLTIDGSGNAKIPATTASSSTSTGALVVGNGSSGGLGVAGAANIGGTVAVSGNTTLNAGSGDGELFFFDNTRLIQTVFGNLYISRGWEYTGGDKARTAEAAVMALQNDGVHFWVNTGLTAGNAYTPTERMWIKTNGTINLPSLPTSASGLSAGDIWNDSGTLKIV
jgi:hypothetical protein